MERKRASGSAAAGRRRSDDRAASAAEDSGSLSSYNSSSYERARARRRERADARREERRRKKSSSSRRSLVVGAYLSACFLSCLYLALRTGRGAPGGGGGGGGVPSPGERSAAVAPANAGTEGAIDRGDQGGGSGRRYLMKFPAGDAPLTEAQEQEVVESARDELDRFPLSIGTDADGTDPGWETIQHPGAEAMERFAGSIPDWNARRRKRPSAKELAVALSGKKLRGGADEASDGDVGGGLSRGPGGRSPAGVLIDEKGYMRVPRLWDPEPYGAIADERERRRRGVGRGDGEATVDGPRDGGVRRYLGDYGSRPMTPAEAKSIGSRVVPPSAGGAREQQQQPLETIFVAIASYRDWQCSSTVESAFKRASHPERIRVGVIDQIRAGEDKPCSVPPGGPCDENPDQATCRHSSQVDYFTVDAELSVGPVFARHLGHRLYRGEYFAMQSDAHVEFVAGWDDEIIEQWHSARNEMAVLSTYLSSTKDHINLETGERTSKSRPIMCESDYEGARGYMHLRHGQQPEGVPYIHDMPTLNPFWAAGFSFARGHFVVNIPYDQHLPWIFQGEEISIGLRGFSYGYDYYSPERSVCYHYYGRKDVPLFWENQSIYRGSAEYGMNRLNAIIHMENPTKDGVAHEWLKAEELKYGLGKVRDLQRFFDTFGIHTKEQRVEKHLCRFVGRPMQKEFIPFLKKNGMGLDYDAITYRYVDKGR